MLYITLAPLKTIEEIMKPFENKQKVNNIKMVNYYITGQIMNS